LSLTPRETAILARAINGQVTNTSAYQLLATNLIKLIRTICHHLQVSRQHSSLKQETEQMGIGTAIKKAPCCFVHVCTKNQNDLK
jgi:hypothetical protein